MRPTKEGILAQAHAAFGQGSGPVRVSQDAMMALTEFCSQRITDDVLNGWERDGTHALERIRAIGRLCSSRIGISGRTVIDRRDVEESSKLVADQSDTGWC